LISLEAPARCLPVTATYNKYTETRNFHASNFGIRRITWKNMNSNILQKVHAVQSAGGHKAVNIHRACGYDFVSVPQYGNICDIISKLRTVNKFINLSVW
jgi:hypothetical protein